MEKIKKVFNLKIISIIISNSFLLTSPLYSCPISKDSLRVPVAENSTYERIKNGMRHEGQNEGTNSPNRTVRVGEGMLTEVFTKESFNRNGIVLVHALAGVPIDGILRPNSYFGNEPLLLRNPREIVEFSWNGVIDSWHSSNVIVLIPFKNVSTDNIINLWYTATAHFGPINIPQGSVLLVREGTELSEQAKANLEGYDITVISFKKDEEADVAARKTLISLGYTPMILNAKRSGIGTNTTWQDEKSGINYFSEKYADTTVKRMKKFAQELHISSSEGTFDYDFGWITLMMERLYNWFPGLGYLNYDKRDFTDFEYKARLAYNSLSSEQKNSPTGMRFLNFIKLYSTLIEINEKLKEYGIFYKKQWPEERTYVINTQNREGFIEFINKMYGLQFTADSLNTIDDLANILSEVIKKSPFNIYGQTATQRMQLDTSI